MRSCLNLFYYIFRWKEFVLILIMSQSKLNFNHETLKRTDYLIYSKKNSKGKVDHSPSNKSKKDWKTKYTEIENFPKIPKRLIKNHFRRSLVAALHYAVLFTRSDISG